jgi:L-amino acid N-acyltransferase YncA
MVKDRSWLFSLSYDSHNLPKRRGYASSCVAALSQLLPDAGWKFCCPFTDLSNPKSNHIYQQIGYTPAGDYNEYVFDGSILRTQSGYDQAQC